MDEPLGGRAAALRDLMTWSAQRGELEAQRRRLISAAWDAGARNITELASAAGVSRDTVYSDLRALEVDYMNKDTDPYLTRLVNAFAQLAMQFAPGTSISEPTRVAFAPVLAIASSAMVALVPEQLEVGITQVLRVDPVGEDDTEALKPFRHELGEAHARYAVRRRPVVESKRPEAAG